MLKKIILITILFLGIINISYAEAYNTNYTDLVVDPTWGCSGIPISFFVYNETQYDNKHDIETDFCDIEDKCDANDCDGDNYDTDKCIPCKRCKWFDLIKNLEVEIYNGPMDSLPLLYSTKISNNEFEFTFDTWNQYLIKIYVPEDGDGIKKQAYNDYETKITIEECSKSTVKKVQRNATDETFSYLNNEIYVELIHTLINDSSKINIIKDAIPPIPLNNSIKTIGITTKEDNFTSVNFKFKFTNYPNTKIQLFKYDTKNNKWTAITNAQKQGEYFIVNNAEFGIYSITQESTIVQETKTEEITQEENLNNNNQEQQTQTEQSQNQEINEPSGPSTNEETSSSNTLYIILGILVILGISIGLYLKFKKPKTNYHDERNEQTKQVLTTYEQTYQETKKYVQKYKDQYSKDQLYRALKSSGVPDDVIDKALNEIL